MPIFPFIQGLAVGLAIAAPVGPIGVLCIRKTLAEGRLAGLVSGLGAATADGLYGALAAFGLSTATAVLTGQTFWLPMAGGAVVCLIGVRTVAAKPSDHLPVAARRGLAQAYATTFFLTLTNPMTILSFAGLIAAKGVSGPGAERYANAVFVFGVFIGSTLWWIILSAAVGHFRSRVTPARMRSINYVCGLALIAFGLWAIGRALT